LRPPLALRLRQPKASSLSPNFLVFPFLLHFRRNRGRFGKSASLNCAKDSLRQAHFEVLHAEFHGVLPSAGRIMIWHWAIVGSDKCRLWAAPIRRDPFKEEIYAIPYILKPAKI
jgi:hypothetical protein